MPNAQPETLTLDRLITPVGEVLLITGPFNLVKWILISVVTLLVYKPLSPLLHHQG